MRTKLEAPYSWSFLEEFFFPDSSDWNAVIALAAAFRRSNEAYLSTVRALVARWDDALHGLGGEPLRENWARFRPLRRSREEDWSDWLAYLLESSRTGRRTAVERTGAHRTLPLGSKVRVTNLRKGRSVLVTINDRGSYRYRRAIDLSYGAARVLGMVHRGVAKVRIELIES